MTSFSESKFEEKLKTLSSSQQSIQTLALWLIHHRKHSNNVVKIWSTLLIKAKPDKHLTFVYLANDVIQNSRKKGPEYNKAFKTGLPDSFSHIARLANAKSIASLKRIVQIWRERKIFHKEYIAKLFEIIDYKAPVVPEKSSLKPEASETSLCSSKTDNEHIDSDTSSSGEKKKTSSRKAETNSNQPKAKKKKKSGPLTLLDEIIAERQTGYNDPPEREELDNAFRKLDDAATIDADVREQIANFPTSVAEPNKADDLEDEEECEQVLKSIKEALDLLETYNDRLTGELSDRRRLSEYLYDYIGAQEKSLQLAKSRLKENKQKLTLVATNRITMEKHLSKLPEDTTAMNNLPTAGDLFFV